MTRILPSDLEPVVSEAYREAGMQDKAADTLGRLAVAAICEHLMGLRVTFGRYALLSYRDRAICDAKKDATGESVADAHNITSRRVRQILTTARKRRS